MGYASRLDLLRRRSPRDLAEVAVPSNYPSIDGELLRLTIEGGDRSAYPADEQAAADAALVRIDEHLADADHVIDGYLMGRVPLPLSSVPAVLTRYAVDIAAYDLAGHKADERDERRYRDAVRYLEQVSAGRISLGLDAGGTEVTTSAGPEYDTPEPVFSRDSLKDF